MPASAPTKPINKELKAPKTIELTSLQTQRIQQLQGESFPLQARYQILIENVKALEAHLRGLQLGINAVLSTILETTGVPPDAQYAPNNEFTTLTLLPKQETPATGPQLVETPE